MSESLFCASQYAFAPTTVKVLPSTTNLWPEVFTNPVMVAGGDGSVVVVVQVVVVVGLVPGGCVVDVAVVIVGRRHSVVR